MLLVSFCLLLNISMKKKMERVLPCLGRDKKENMKEQYLILLERHTL